MNDEALSWYAQMGVDEAIEDEPINRMQDTPITPEPQTMTKPTVTHKKPIAFDSPANMAFNTKEQADKCNNLAELEKAVRAFDGLSIAKTATNTVFCDGIADSDIMMIGEAPGAEEDAQGIPFCGASGKMLDQMLGHVGLSRETNFYITNTIFWRPPGNRRPTPEELAICLPFVEKHIALMQPKLIILVGGTAITSILNAKQGITKLRGQLFDYNNNYLEAPIPTTPIFHPSYLLRSPGQKRLVWQDLLMIKAYVQKHGIKT
jgi:uracil-DNA glycosylase family 4